MNKTAIETKRIRLRLIDIADKYNALGIPNSIEETKANIEPWIKENQLQELKNYTFAIDNKSNGKFMGLFGLKIGHQKYNRAEVWYKIHSDYWRKGFATEALKAILDFGFDTLKLHRIEAGCAVENIGSIKVLEKSGMVREGRLRQILPLKSGWSDNFQYSILETDKRIKQL